MAAFQAASNLQLFFDTSQFSALLEAERALIQQVVHLHYLLPKERLIKYLEKLWITKQTETTSHSENLLI